MRKTKNEVCLIAVNKNREKHERKGTNVYIIYKQDHVFDGVPRHRRDQHENKNERFEVTLKILHVFTGCPRN